MIIFVKNDNSNKIYSEISVIIHYKSKYHYNIVMLLIN